MKKRLIILSSILLTQCGSADKKTTTDIINSGELPAIQNKKAEVVKAINGLQAELEQLNTAIAEVDTEQKLLLVTVIPLKETSYDHFVSFQGTLETDQNIVLYPELPGLLKNIAVKEGQKVKKGTPLATVSDGGLIDQLQQLQLQRDLAKTTYERQQRLWDQKIGSEIQYLQAKTQYLSLQKSVTQMNDQVSKTTIKAPFDGLVDHIMADTGSNMMPGSTPVMRVVNLDHMKVVAEIPEKHLPNIQKNSAVKITIPVLGESRPAVINAVGNFINPNNRSFRIEIDLDNTNGRLKPNMTVQLNINDYQNPKAILVPSKNILEDQKGQTYVYKIEKVENQKNTFRALKTFVKTGKSTNHMTEIIDGLSAGERLIEDGIRLVEDQQLVKIIQS
ncbi:MAG: efflux RND transporter periplasmic adaptor subunit [Flavobacteriaceae bacterium]